MRSNLETDDIRKENLYLKKQIQKYQEKEKALAEREKELQCLYSIDKLLDRPNISFTKILQGVVNFIPPAMQYPEYTHARIVWQEESFSSAGFSDSEKKLNFPLKKSQLPPIGELLVTISLPELEFLKEEESMLRSIAERIGHVAERYANAEAIKQSQNYFKALTENAQDIISILEADGTIRFESDATFRILGYKATSRVGYPAFDFVHPHDVQRVKQTFGKLLKAPGSIQTIELRYQNSTGQYKHLEAIGRNMTHHPDIRGVIVNSRDISNRKKMRLLLSQYKRAVESSPNQIVMIDNEFRYVFVNQKYLEYSGLKNSQVQGRKISEVEHYHNFTTELKPRLKRCLKGETITYEANIRYKQKGERQLFISYSPVFDENNQIQGIVGSFRDISDFKLARKKIEENENKYRALFKNNGSVMLLIEPQTGRIADANHAACHFYGYPYSSLLGMNIDQINILEEEKVKQAMQTAQEGQKNLFYFKHRLANGEIRDVEVYSGKIVIQDEQLLYSVIHDITSRKLAEKALIESEKKLRTLMENAPIPLLVADMAKQVEFVNKKFTQIFGYNLNELFNTNAWWNKAVVNQQDDNKKPIPWQKALKKLQESGEPEQWKIRTQSGQIKNVELNLMTIGNLNIISASDVTEQNNAMQTIAQNESRLRSLLRISQYESQSVRELLDFALREALKLTASQLGYIYFYNEEKQEFILNSWSKEAMNECRIVQPETIYQLKNTGLWGEVVRQRRPIVCNDYTQPNPYIKGYPAGHVKLKKFLSIPVTIENQIVAVIGLANKQQDYTISDVQQISLLMDSVWKIVQQRRYQQQIIEAKERAEKSDRLKSSFLANLSHEVRTPMNGIIGFCEMLKRRKRSPQEQENFINIIWKSSHELLRTINDVLDMSKIETQELDIIKGEFSINELIDQSQSFFNELALTSQKTIQILAKKALPDNQSTMFSDEVRVKQIFANLIGNALKFTPKGKIEFGYHTPKNGQITCFVKDTGIGIAPEKQSFIFERFRQADESHTRRYGGTGLGLSIAKALVEMLDGKIWLKSEPGKGTEFFFDLPFQAQQPQETKFDSEHETKQAFSRQMPNWAEKIILIVEDDYTSFEYLKEIIAPTQAQILYADTGLSGIDICRRNNQIDLILMDIRMPDMSGYEATKTVKKLRPQIKVIAQTASTSAHEQKKCRQAGCDGFIFKPIHAQNLLKLLAKHL